VNILHQQASKTALRFFQSWVFGIWLAIMLWDPLTDLAKFPTAGYTPTGFMLRMFPESLKYLPVSFSFLLCLKITILSACILILFNQYKKFAGLIACFSLSIYQGIVRSFGHINHPEVMLLHAVFILTIYYFFEKDLEQLEFLDQEKQITIYSIPIIMTLFFFAFTYAFAGIHRIAFGGIDVFTNESIVYWVVENGRRSRLINFNLDWVILKFQWIEYSMRAGLWVVTAAEIMAPFCLISKWVRYFFLIVILPFHIMVGLFMGIMFWENLILFILFIDFTSFKLFKKQQIS